MTKRTALWVIAIVFMGNIVLLARDLITPSDAILLLLTTGLMLATLGLWYSTEKYVKETSDIAKAAQEQAQASLKMTEEMQKTRIDNLRPLLTLVMGLPDENKRWLSVSRVLNSGSTYVRISHQ